MRLLWVLMAPIVGIALFAGSPDERQGSASHAACIVPPRTIVGESWNLPDNRTLPFGKLAARNGWTVFSRGINRLRVYAGDSAETWLGTDDGIKRINHDQKTVRHYTQLDGLPGAEIGALVSSGKNVWCTVPLRWTKRDVTVLCRFDRVADRWIPVREIAHRRWSDTAAERPHRIEIPDGAVSMGVSDKIVAAVPTHLPSLTTTYFYLFNHSGELIREVPWEPSCRAAARIIVTTFVTVTGDDVWLGTNQGLLRYSLSRQTWQKYLPGQVIHAGGEERGVLWLAVSDRTADVAPVPPGGLLREDFKWGMEWRLTRFDAATGRHQEHRAPEAGKPQDLTGPWIPSSGRMKVDTEGKVWIAPRYSGVLILDGPAWERPTLFLRFDPELRAWEEWLPPDQHARLTPDELRFPALPHTLFEYSPMKLAKLYAAKLPAWFCADAEVPESVTSGLRWSTVSPGSDGSFVWKNPAGVEDRIPAPDGMNPRDVSFWMVSESPTHLWALIYVRQEPNEGTQHVGRFERATRKWTVWSNKDVWPSIGANRRIVADGDRAWAISTGSTSMFDPRENRWIDVTIALAKESWARPEIVDVHPDGRYAWLLIQGFQHPQPVAMPADRKKDTSLGRLTPPLVRWDKTDGTFQFYDPRAQMTFYSGRAMLVEESFVWLATGDGFFRLIKQTGAFDNQTPPLYVANPNRIPHKIQRLNGDLWLGGHDVAWRLDSPSR